MKSFVRTFLLGISLLPFSAAASTAIDQVVVSGNQRIQQSTIENYMGLSRGSDVSRSDLDAAIKKLYATGFFSNITLDMEGTTLRVVLDENPSISRVAFEGNSALSDEDLEKEVTLKARSIYTRPRVQADLKRLLDVYRRNGRYSAVVTPKIITQEQNRVDLVYEISEGPEATIQNVSFIGNDSFSSSDLAKVISSSQSRWYQFLTDSDKYDPDRLQYDQELLRKFYFENGYADFKIKSAIAELSPQRDAFYLVFTVEEGEQYRFGKVDVKGNLPKGRLPDFNEDVLTKSGDIYNASDVEASIDAMVNRLGDKGFAFVDINPVLARKKENNERIIDLTYDIKEGPRVYVERINIFGNERTLDEVIRREFRIAEGDPFSTSKLKRTEQRLNNLGFFESVEIKQQAGSAPDKAQLDVEVKEQSTGEVSFGAGFSTTDGALADIGLREKNFLGRGQELRTRALFAARRQQYDIGFTEPYFLGRELSAGFDLYKTTQDLREEASFDREATGGALRLGYALSEHWNHTLRYAYERSEITNIDANASRYIREQEGQNTTSMVGHSLAYDTRDNRFNPNKGLFFSLGQDFAGVGGDDTFIRHEVKSEYYIPVAKKWVGMLGAQGGHIAGIGEDVRINQRFFIGSQEIRGFQNAGIGPRDITTSDALGGNVFYAGTAELRFPLGLPEELGVSGAVFNDVASLWDLDSTGNEIRDTNSIRASAGVGVAWVSPFGPIRIDFAKAYLKEDYDEDELVRFSFGTRF